MKTLVWLTHTFRKNSRLTNELTGPCSFVYYSPYYFAGKREREILSKCSTENLEWFYYSINSLSNELSDAFRIYKEQSPIDHINKLSRIYGYNKLVIDKPLFSMWKTIDLSKLQIPYEIIDSDLIEIDCRYKTAKHRWMDHVTKLRRFDKAYQWNTQIKLIPLTPKGESYPKVDNEKFKMKVNDILTHGSRIRPTYSKTRDAHNGQTRLSTLFQNGIADPHNVFYAYANAFYNEGADLTKNEGNLAAMLRQFTFRELSIISARQSGLTMESSVNEWAKAFLTEKSYENLISHENPKSQLTFDKIKNANTGDILIDQILKESYKTGVMPNRARMLFAGWMFYNAPSGSIALNWLIDTFDLLLVDGQCPTNYTQCCSSMNLQYGKVMHLNKNNVKNLLSYE